MWDKLSGIAFNTVVVLVALFLAVFISDIISFGNDAIFFIFSLALFFGSLILFYEEVTFPDTSAERLRKNWRIALIILGFIWLVGMIVGIVIPPTVTFESDIGEDSDINMLYLIVVGALLFGSYWLWETRTPDTIKEKVLQYISAEKIQLQIIKEQMESSDRSGDGKILKAIAKLQETSTLHRSYRTKNMGIELLIQLANEDLENRYIRCIELLAISLKENYNRWPLEYELCCLIFDFLRQDFDGREKLVQYHMDKSGCEFWPNFSDVNFEKLYGGLDSKPSLEKANWQKANLQEANLGRANLEDANFSMVNLSNVDLSWANLEDTNFSMANLSKVDLSWANLTLADMSEAKGLTVEQILSAEWSNYDGKGKPPKLPKYLLDDQRIQEWLSEPHD